MGARLGLLANGRRVCRLGAAAAGSALRAPHRHQAVGGQPLRYRRRTNTSSSLTRRSARERITTAVVPEERNVTIVTQTTNVTNITYNNTYIVNEGPNYDELRVRSRRPSSVCGSIVDTKSRRTTIHARQLTAVLSR